MHCCKERTYRNEEEKKKLINRLKKAEGQIRGIQKMVEEDVYCPEILIQVSALTGALNAFNRELLSRHIQTCVHDDIVAGNNESMDELMEVLQRLMK